MVPREIHSTNLLTLLLLLVGIFGACQVVDVCTTLYAINLGGQELNPMMAGIVEHPAIFWGVKIAVIGIFAFVGRSIFQHMDRPRVVRMGLVGLSLAVGVAGIPVFSNLIILVDAGMMSNHILVVVLVITFAYMYLAVIRGIRENNRYNQFTGGLVE